MTFTLTINMDNDAFAEDAFAELYNILHLTAGRLHAYRWAEGSVLDSNGNTVGGWEITP